MPPKMGRYQASTAFFRVKHAIHEQSYFETETGPIDILVNNAGMQFRTPLEDFPAEAFSRLWKSLQG